MCIFLSLPNSKIIIVDDTIDLRMTLAKKIHAA